MKVHLRLAPNPLAQREAIADLVATGTDGIFTFEGQRDVFLPLAVAAYESDLELMTNVAIALPRSPLHLAHTAYDLQEMSGGKFRLGIGSQIRVHIEKRYGTTWDKPAKQMGESVAAMKAIFAAWNDGEPLKFRGEYWTHTLMAPSFNPGPIPSGPPPILMGALGPIMTRTAAELADGLLVMPFNSRRHFAERTLPAIREGWSRAGRDGSGFETIVQAMVATGRTEQELREAIDGVAKLMAFYASTPAYMPVLEVEGWAHIQPELNRLSKIGAFPEMRALITDEMVRTIAIVGTPEECAAEIASRFGEHSEQVCCYFPGYRPDPQHVSDLITALHKGPRNG